MGQGDRLFVPLSHMTEKEDLRATPRSNSTFDSNGC
ncbi:MAG: hypothetical protein H6Q66_1558 [Firmicutes bacterium]|nr:hypothetical protein [Bacillota bacterium]